MWVMLEDEGIGIVILGVVNDGIGVCRCVKSGLEMMMMNVVNENDEDDDDDLVMMVV